MLFSLAYKYMKKIGHSGKIHIISITKLSGSPPFIYSISYCSLPPCPSSLAFLLLANALVIGCCLAGASQLSGWMKDHLSFRCLGLGRTGCCGWGSS